MPFIFFYFFSFFDIDATEIIIPNKFNPILIPSNNLDMKSLRLV